MNSFILRVKKVISLFALIFVVSHSMGQTTTIDYLSSGLSTSACNVFSSNQTIGGVVHSSYAGGVTFNTTSGINVSTQNHAIPFSGVGFYINYNFQTGYNYDISITGEADINTYINTSILNSLSGYATNGMSACGLDANVPNWNKGGYGQAAFQGTGASKIYSIPTLSVSSSGYSIFLIWATGGNPNYSSDGFSISKIVITKTATGPSFNVTPTTTTLTCGNTSPQTFTVNNPDNATGITDYTWNLGATPNGWKLSNGTAAPATYSTGTTNTLTLTPVCGSGLSNISATVTANGTQYNTNVSNTTVNAPSLSVSGNSTICSGSATYTVANLPCNASVTWSASPAGIVSLSCTSCNSTTLTKTGDGSVTLTGTVSGVCGSNPIVVTKTIAVGYSLTGTITQNGVNSTLYTDNSISAGATSVTFQWPGVTSINCYQSSTNPSTTQTGFIYYPSQSRFWFTLSSGQSITVSFSGTGCGGTEVATRSFHVGGYYYAVSPNPASASINVAPLSKSNNVKTATSNKSATSTVSITDVNGTLKKQQQFSSTSTNMKLDVSGLIPGTYFVHITNGIINETHQLIIK